MRRAVGIPALVLALAAACSSAAPGERDRPDAAPPIPRPDASDGPPGSDAGSDSCLDQVPDDWGDTVPVDSSQSSFDGNFTFFADMVPETEPFQLLIIALHPNQGVFTGPVEPGTYVIEGDEADYSWCGACVYLSVDDGGGAPSQLYMAQSGKLIVDSVDTDIHGRLESAELVQIDIVFNGPSCADYQEGDPWPCGNSACLGSTELCGVQDLIPDCRTTIDSIPF